MQLNHQIEVEETSTKYQSMMQSELENVEVNYYHYTISVTDSAI